MVTVTRHIFIDAPVERVFALMADPAARSALAPHAKPIRVEIEGGELLRAGSVCHFRLRMDDRIVDYRTRVLEFWPNELIVSVSDTAVPFQIRVETRPEGHGTRLVQTEQFEPTEDMLLQAQTPTPLNRVMEQIYRLLPLFSSDYVTRVRREREQILAGRLEENLERWLAAIKRRLEAGNR